MPNYLIGVYEERFGTIVVEADDEMLAAEKVEELLQEHASITEVSTFDEQSFDKGVAIDASEPEELRLAISEVINDS